MKFNISSNCSLSYFGVSLSTTAQKCCNVKWSRKCEKGKKLDFEALLVSFMEEHNSENELYS